MVKSGAADVAQPSQRPRRTARPTAKVIQATQEPEPAIKRRKYNRKPAVRDESDGGGSSSNDGRFGDAPAKPMSVSTHSPSSTEHDSDELDQRERSRRSLDQELLPPDSPPPYSPPPRVARVPSRVPSPSPTYITQPTQPLRTPLRPRPTQWSQSRVSHRQARSQSRQESRLQRSYSPERQQRSQSLERQLLDHQPPPSAQPKRARVTKLTVKPLAKPPAKRRKSTAATARPAAERQRVEQQTADALSLDTVDTRDRESVERLMQEHTPIPPIDTSFTFSSQWIIQVDSKGAHLGSKANEQIKSGDASLALWHRFNEWLLAWLQEHATYSLVRKQLRATHARRKKEFTVCEDVVSTSADSYKAMLVNLQHWSDSGKTDLRCDLAVAVLTAIPSTPAVNGRRRGGGAFSATQLLRTQAQEQRDNAAMSDDQVVDPKEKLVRLWSCKDSACLNYPKTCWQPGANKTAEHHYPLYPDVFTAWCQAMTDSTATESSPPPELIIRLTRSKHTGRTRTSSSRTAVQTTHSGGVVNVTVPVHFNAASGMVTSGETPTLAPYQRTSSSPPAWLPSSQITESEVEGFFDWLKNERYFQKAHRFAAVDRMRVVVFDEKDLSLKQLATATSADWNRWGLMEGHYTIVMRSIRKYRKLYGSGSVSDDGYLEP